MSASPHNLSNFNHAWTIRRYSVSEVRRDPQLHQALSRLHLRQGLMWKAYLDCVKYPNRNGKVWVAFVNDKPVGWCLRFRLPYNRTLKMYIYVQRKYRRTGIGTALSRRATLRIPRILIEPWDPVSEAFFNSWEGSLDKKIT